MEMSKPVLVIGGGAMGGALASRWHAAGMAPVAVVERDDARRAVLTAQGMMCYASLDAAVGPWSTVVLAIKPQQFSDMRDALRAVVGDALLVSIMAGIALASLRTVSARCARVMPNLPAMIGEGMTVGCAALGAADLTTVARLFDAVGRFAWLATEEEIHAATAISGSGPGYVFAFMEALEKAGVVQGLTPELARTLVTQTLRGAALLADGSVETVATLRTQVTSPNGVTQAALEAFGHGNFDGLMGEAAAAAVRRSRELAE